MLIRSYTDLELRVRDFGRKIASREEGASLVEYALLVALIAIVCILAISFVGGRVSTTFSSVGNSF